LSTQLQQSQAAQTELSENLASSAAKQDQAVKVLQEERDAERTSHEAASRRLQEELYTAKVENDAALDKLREEHAAELEKVREGASASQSNELDALRKNLTDEKESWSAALKKLQDELDVERAKREETEKEHEDLLVLLEELSQKRKKDKERMKEKGMEVSEGEDEDDEDDDAADDTE
jgi:hypothetical protein